jgi:hypothetical protein
MNLAPSRASRSGIDRPDKQRRHDRRDHDHQRRIGAQRESRDDHGDAEQRPVVHARQYGIDWWRFRAAQETHP